jgi:hypothetical protein
VESDTLKGLENSVNKILHDSYMPAFPSGRCIVGMGENEFSLSSEHMAFLISSIIVPPLVTVTQVSHDAS